MAEKCVAAQVIGQRWVHSFEEDTANVQVYRPQSWDFPLSRRPRAAFELRADGTAQLFLPGASDRPEGKDASWTEESGELLVRTAQRGAISQTTLRIIESTADKLFIRRS